LGDLAGHVMSPYLEITWLGNKFFTAAMEFRAVWLVAPSCWKKFLRLLNEQQAQDLRISAACERNVVRFTDAPCIIFSSLYFTNFFKHICEVHTIRENTEQNQF
jgi:hypothetical protein